MARFVVGIDLGTTHTVVAYAEAGAIELLPIPQLIAPGEVAALPLLPSQRYQAADGELAAADLQLPWASSDPLIGEIARRLGAQVPGRSVTSAKSWLSHAAVDRLATILPWGADASVAKVSPVQASASYLAHVRAAWNHRHPDHPLEQQEVVLTVPASFDDAARELTLAAARDAGLPAALRLLEEPQAALYDWLHRERSRLAEALAQSRSVLVCDVGGGTTDLSLIRVRLDGAAPVLERVGVGSHLMLGGDNMDLALAHLVEARLKEPKRLSAGCLAQLVERCRAAKEQLLARDAPAQVAVTLLGGGSRLVGASRSVELARDEVRALVVDGFFPRVPLDAPLQRARAGLLEFGLPYASDPAVTRHVAQFLREQQEVPDTLLLNGGVFRADALRERLIDTLAQWRGGMPPVELRNDDPDVAVARGAVAYALALRGDAPRIGGGSPRAYALVLDAARRQAVCVLPRGSEALAPQRLADRSFALRVGEPVRFHLVASRSARPAAGELVDLDAFGGVDLPPLTTVVQPAADDRRREIPVQIVTAMSEVGTLAMDCEARGDPARRWRLTLQLRGEGAGGASLPERLADAIADIEAIFGARGAKPDAKAVKQLRARLEKRLGARERWDLALLRPLYDALWQRAKGRRRSAEHERVWLNLAGYCLRPGFGDALDGWRAGELWTLFEQGLAHGADAQVRAEWWTLWRRIAGGLEEAAQQRLLDDFAQNLEALEQRDARLPAAVVKGSFDDMVRLGAALERVPASYKVEIGDWLLGKLESAEAATQALWALGRLGARRPLGVSVHAVVPADVAERWLEALFALDWKRHDNAAFAAAQIARATADRTRDVSEAMRQKTAARLAQVQAAPRWIAMVNEAIELDAADERQAYGEALPPGLRLIS